MKKPVRVAGIDKADMKPQKSVKWMIVKIGSNRSFGIVFFISFLYL